MPPKRYPLPKRFNTALSEAAYAKLRELNARYGLSNNYVLTVLLEKLDDYADSAKLAAAFEAFIDDYGAPAPGGPAKGE